MIGTKKIYATPKVYEILKPIFTTIKNELSSAQAIDFNKNFDLVKIKVNDVPRIARKMYEEDLLLDETETSSILSNEVETLLDTICYKYFSMDFHEFLKDILYEDLIKILVDHVRPDPNYYWLIVSLEDGIHIRESSSLTSTTRPNPANWFPYYLEEIFEEIHYPEGIDPDGTIKSEGGFSSDEEMYEFYEDPENYARDFYEYVAELLNKAIESIYDMISRIDEIKI